MSKIKSRFNSLLIYSKNSYTNQTENKKLSKNWNFSNTDYFEYRENQDILNPSQIQRKKIELECKMNE